MEAMSLKKRFTLSRAKEQLIHGSLFVCALFSILTTLGIIYVLVTESVVSLTGDAAFVEDPVRGNVMSFSGNGWLATGTFVAELGNADFSYAAWVKTTQAGGVIVSKQNDDATWQRAEKKLYIGPGTGGCAVAAASAAAAASHSPASR